VELLAGKLVADSLTKESPNSVGLVKPPLALP
jgi:hypothetical protein